MIAAHPSVLRHGVSRLALVGNPNSGKSTVFNALTGLRQKTANYAGVTVEKKMGRFRGLHGEIVDVLDLPGSYSLRAQSPDEEIARDVLLGRRDDAERPDAIVNVVDASNLERNLYLTSQLLDLGIPIIIVLNMMDVAAAHGIRVDIEALERELGAPVVAMTATKNHGMVALKACLSALAPQTPKNGTRDFSGSAAEIERRYEWVQKICVAAVRFPQTPPVTFSEHLDVVLTHPVLGWGFFILVMGLMFYSIFSVASWPMAGIEAATNAAGSWLNAHLPEGDLRSLLADGVVAGVGGVVVFLPQILILFFFLGLLEDSGYMARAAFLMDRLMTSVGLHGRSFVPLLSSFACAIPGIMASRTIDNRNDRLLTILISPFMSCSARLPVYALMLALLLPNESGGAWRKAAIMLAMYVLGVAAAFGTAWLLKRTILRGETSMLLLEMPPYRRPSLRAVAMHMWERAVIFLSNAGTVILALSVILWALATYPKPANENASASAALTRSAAGWLGRSIEPVIEPLGFDWKIGIGLIASFAAREVFVGTMAIVHNVGADVDDERTLREALAAQTRADGTPLYTPLVCVALMVFYVLALQCMSTLAVVRRETNSWRWPIFQFVYMAALAYGVTLAVYQGGRWLGFQ